MGAIGRFLGKYGPSFIGGAISALGFQGTMVVVEKVKERRAQKKHEKK